MPDTTNQQMKGQSGYLLDKDDPAPYDVFNETGQARCIIVCDHAGNTVPKKLCSLGLSKEELNKHYATDIGVRDVAKKLAELLDAPCLLGNYSRLVIDLNRHQKHSTAMPVKTEDGDVPGNIDIPEEEKTARIKEIHAPYHAEIEQKIETFRNKNIIPVIISIHSFTPSFFKQKRPWEIGVLWVRDPRLPVPVIKRLEDKGYCVGNNEPYDARMLWGTTVNTHADAHGLPNILFEIRNDLLSSIKEKEAIAALLADVMAPELKKNDLYSLYEGEDLVHDPAVADRYFDELVKKAKQGE